MEGSRNFVAFFNIITHTLTTWLIDRPSDPLTAWSFDLSSGWSFACLVEWSTDWSIWLIDRFRDRWVLLIVLITIRVALIVRLRNKFMNKGSNCKDSWWLGWWWFLWMARCSAGDRLWFSGSCNQTVIAWCLITELWDWSDGSFSTEPPVNRLIVVLFKRKTPFRSFNASNIQKL